MAWKMPADLERKIMSVEGKDGVRKAKKACKRIMRERDVTEDDMTTALGMTIAELGKRDPFKV